MIEQWFIVSRRMSQGFFIYNVTRRSFHMSPIAAGTHISRMSPWYVGLYSIASREEARRQLDLVKRHGTQLAQSARIVRVRKWSKGERAKLACDWAGIPTLENGKTISTGRRVELLAERAMGLGATVHQQRVKLLDLGTKLDLAERAVERNKPAPGVVEAALKRSKQPRKRPVQRGNRS